MKPVGPGDLPPWRRPRPEGARRALSPAQRQAARERAAQAGRHYPNLVDNMWAARHVSPGEPASTGDAGPD